MIYAGNELDPRVLIGIGLDLQNNVVRIFIDPGLTKMYALSNCILDLCLHLFFQSSETQLCRKWFRSASLEWDRIELQKQ